MHKCGDDIDDKEVDDDDDVDDIDVLFHPLSHVIW